MNIYNLVKKSCGNAYTLVSWIAAIPLYSAAPQELNTFVASTS